MDETTKPTATSRVLATMVAISGIGAVILWAMAAGKAYQADSDLDAIADSFVIDASAIQLCQVADQSLLALTGPFSLAMAATVVLIMFVGLSIVSAPR